VKIQKPPQTTPSATQNAEHPSAGTPGTVDSAQALTGRSTPVSVPAVARENEFGEALEAMTRAMATNVRDWAADRMDAFLWAVLLGWDCDEQHEHDEDACSLGAMDEIAARHGWDDHQVERVRRFHRAVLAASGSSPTEEPAFPAAADPIQDVTQIGDDGGEGIRTYLVPDHASEPASQRVNRLRLPDPHEAVIPLGPFKPQPDFELPTVSALRLDLHQAHLDNQRLKEVITDFDNRLRQTTRERDDLRHRLAIVEPVFAETAKIAAAAEQERDELRQQLATRGCEPTATGQTEALPADEHHYDTSCDDRPYCEIPKHHALEDMP
jgi:hypothetical protein